MMALPALDTMMTFSPGATRRTEMSSSPSFRLMAMRPSRRVRSYSSMDVFFTMPCSVANMQVLVGREVLRRDDGAEMVSPFSSGSRFTMAVPRAWRDASGSSYTFRRYTLPFSGEEQHVGMGGGHEQVLDVVVVLQVHALHALAAALLLAVRRHGQALHVAGAWSP